MEGGLGDGPPPSQMPRLSTIVHLIAGLGGYVERHDSVPGARTLWIGLQRMRDFADAWIAFRPQKRRKDV